MVADDGELIAGHGRVLAATMLGLTEVPVIRLGHLDETERRAYRIADNKLTELGEWDEAMLRDEIAGLLAEDFDLTLLGITDDDLDALLQDPDADGEDGPVEGEDDVPEAPATPVSVAEDLWQLGSHRLICGDSTSADVIGRLLGDVRPLLMVTDPPYGVEYDPGWRNHAGAASTKRTGKVLNDDRADWREAWALFPGDVAYVWHGALHAGEVADSLTASGFAIRSQIIWAKDRLVLSRGDYHWQHEPCWYAVRAKGKGHWAGDRKQTTLWQIASRDQDAETVHGTQKPVECMRRPHPEQLGPGQAVYEPFMGSGTTLIAAETTGRVCYGVELNPAYVDVAIERWQAFTGEDAVLTETGETFTALKTRRLCPAGMAEDARAQRGARYPHLCPGRGVDPRGRPVRRADVAKPRATGRGGDRRPRAGHGIRHTHRAASGARDHTPATRLAGEHAKVHGVIRTPRTPYRGHRGSRSRKPKDLPLAGRSSGPTEPRPSPQCAGHGPDHRSRRQAQDA